MKTETSPAELAGLPPVDFYSGYHLKAMLLWTASALFLSMMFADSPAERGGEDFNSLQSLAQRVLAENPTEALSAIAALRLRGSEGLEALFSFHAGTIEQQKLNSSQGRLAPASGAWQTLRMALDAIAQQRDCHASRLYAELFLMPDSDPWLGLAPRDTYSAFENGGLAR